MVTIGQTVPPVRCAAYRYGNDRVDRAMVTIGQTVPPVRCAAYCYGNDRAERAPCEVCNLPLW